MFVFGSVLIFMGLLMDNWLPINKNLWTSTYSVFMAGLALNIRGLLLAHRCQGLQEVDQTVPDLRIERYHDVLCRRHYRPAHLSYSLDRCRWQYHCLQDMVLSDILPVDRRSDVCLLPAFGCVHARALPYCLGDVQVQRYPQSVTKNNCLQKQQGPLP